MSGGGGSQTVVQQASIPKFVEDAAKANLARADYVSQLGYVPYYGPDVAAMSPMQTQAMQATGSGMQALGLAPQGFDPIAGMPQPQTFMGGLQGYSSGALYDQALQQLQQNRPGQYDALTGMFIDPQSGDLDVAFTPAGSIAMPTAQAGSIAAVGASGGDSESFHGGSTGSMLGGPLDFLGTQYNKSSTAGKLFSPLMTGAGYLADKMMRSQGYEMGNHGYHDPRVTNTTPADIQAGYMAAAYGDSSDDSGKTYSVADIANANQQSAYDAMGGFYSN